MIGRGHHVWDVALLFSYLLTHRAPLVNALSARPSLPTLRQRLPRKWASSRDYQNFSRWGIVPGHVTDKASQSRKMIIISKTAAFVRKWSVPILLSPMMLKVPAALAASKSASSLPAVLGTPQLLASTALVSFFGGFIMSHIGINKLAGEILAACARSTLQLFLLGAFVLQKLFGTTKPAIVWTWIVGVGLVAAREAYSRVEYTYDKLRWHITFSVLTR